MFSPATCGQSFDSSLMRCAAWIRPGALATGWSSAVSEVLEMTPRSEGGTAPPHSALTSPCPQWYSTISLKVK